MRIIIILLISFQYLTAQEPFNHRLENGEIQAFGHLIYELDSSYLCIGRGFDTLDFIRGAYATEIDKENGRYCIQLNMVCRIRMLTIIE